MPISRYPRAGHPISPSVLSPLLKRKAPKVRVPLAELDASSWERLGHATCRKLAKIVVEHLARQIDDIVKRFGSRRIAPAGSNLKRRDLDLEVRTYNCLGIINIDEHPDGLAGITIREAMKIRAFGIKSLVDLLTSVEAIVGNASAENKPGQTAADSKRNGFLPAGNCDVIRRSGFIPNSMADLHVPRPPSGVKLTDLRLRARTFNALKKAGYAKDPSKLGDLTLRQAIQIPSFGTESLCDLIEAIERVEHVRYPLLSQGNIRRDEGSVLLDLLKDAKSIPECVLESSVPPLPPGINIDELGLCRRTYNVLDREGFGESPEQLWKTTIADLCKLPGFGQVCLVDLLESVSRIRESADFTKPATKSRYREVEELLQVLCSSSDAAAIGQADPRLGPLLQQLGPGAVNVGDLHDLGYQITMLGRTQELKKLYGECERCRKLTIEAELMEIVVTKQASERNRQVVADYYGLGGGPLVTLEALGGKYKISRERVRQICAPSKIAKLPAPPFAPILDTVLTLVRDSLPSLKVDLERERGVNNSSKTEPQLKA